MRFRIKNSGGGTHSDSRVVLVNEESRNTARLDIANTAAFSLTVRLYAYTMAKNTYLNVPLRVCGAESISVLDSSAKFYIEGIVEGDVNSMSEATRYIVIPQSTFATWFRLSPTSDPCTPKEYELYASISPLVPWSPNDPTVQLIGSFNSYKVRLDKTVATNTKTVYLRVITRGLVTAD
jgi:hypothetical protein